MDVVSHYKLGGLKSDDKSSIISIDEIQYVVGDKFKTMLRDSIIDWNSFLEIYHDSMEENTMFDHVIRLLNIKDTKNIKIAILPLLKTVYNLPAEAHIAAMNKQFMLYEPVSYAIHGLFTTIKNHYEYIVEKYVIARNRYILLHKLKDHENDWVKLMKEWTEMNNNYYLDSSSIILLFLNPPKGLKSGLHIDIKGIPETSELRLKLKKFNYPGFCPKVPKDRLNELLKFPLESFILAAKKLDPELKFPDYRKIERECRDILSRTPKPPEIIDHFERESEPEFDDSKFGKNRFQDILTEKVKWYVEKIFDFRKRLAPYGKKYEEYYSNHAVIITEINRVLKEYF